jgi:hypothetical protein
MVKKNKTLMASKKKVKKAVPSPPPPMPRREKSVLSSLGALTLRGLGAAAGGILGNPALGYQAGAGISKWMGMGDYELTSNSIIEKHAKGVPFMHKSGQTTRVQHREYIQDVITSSSAGTFQTTQFPLNPGVSATFPWLSVLAQQYQEYTFKGLVFHFVSTSGDSVASTNTALGSVIMATQYRSTSAPFTNKTAMLNEYFSCDGKPSEDIAHPVECDPKENPFNVQYVRTGNVPSGEDEKMYDLGTFNFATVGYPGTSSNVGELWVTYDIELRKPQVASLAGIQDAHYTGNGTYSTANAFGTSAVTQVYDNIGIQINFSNKQIDFPLSNQTVNYAVSVVYQGVTAYAASGFSFGAFFSSLNIFRTVGAFNSNYTVGTGTAVTTQFVTVTGNSGGVQPVMAFNTPTTLTGATTLDIYVWQLNSAAT